VSRKQPLLGHELGDVPRVFGRVRALEGTGT
jgi:hypothetical protein